MALSRHHQERWHHARPPIAVLAMAAFWNGIIFYLYFILFIFTAAASGVSDAGSAFRMSGGLQLGQLGSPFFFCLIKAVDLLPWYSGY